MANSASAKSVRMQTDYQQWALGNQQEFARNMAETAHQREVVDLRRAGLNPILSGTGGRGNPQSPGAVPSGASYKAENVAAGAVSSALALQRQRQEMSLMRQQERTSRQGELTERNVTEQEGYNANILRIESEAQQRAAHGKGYLESRAAEIAAGARRRAAADRIEGDIDTEGSGEILRRLERGGNAAGSIMRNIPRRPIYRR